LIKTREAKIFAEKNLTGVLRDILLSEKDELTPEEFLAKAEIWLRLLHKEGSR